MAITEKWLFTNNSGLPISITDIVVPYILQTGVNGTNIDLMNLPSGPPYNTAESLASSIIIRSATLSGALVSDYTHGHDDYSETSHTHTGFDILMGGVGSDADSLHTHDSLTTVADVNDLIAAALVGGIDLSGYVTKAGYINQLSDISSSGAAIENAVTKAHDESHTLLEHLDDGLVTTTKLTTLMDGSNADCCHTHSFDGEDGISVHNDLTGIQGGVVDEYYHLTSDQANIVSRLDEDSAGLTFDGESIGGGGGGGVTAHSALTGLAADDHTQYLLLAGRGGQTVTDDIILPDGYRVYFGENQESFIYYDSQDLRIGFSNPSIGPLTQKVRINDDLLVEGLLTVGSNLQIDGDNSIISSTSGTISFADENLITTGDITCANINVDARLSHNGDADTYIEFTNNQIDMLVGGINFISMDETLGIVINAGAVDLDFNILWDSGIAIGIDGLTGNVSMSSDLTVGTNSLVVNSTTDAVDMFGTLTVGGDINLDSNSNKLYFGTTQSSSIYYDGTDLNITLNDPSQTGVIKLTDTVNIDGHIDCADYQSTTGDMSINAGSSKLTLTSGDTMTLTADNGTNIELVTDAGIVNVTGQLNIDTTGFNQFVKSQASTGSAVFHTMIDRQYDGAPANGDGSAFRFRNYNNTTVHHLGALEFAQENTTSNTKAVIKTYTSGSPIDSVIIKDDGMTIAQSLAVNGTILTDTMASATTSSVAFEDDIYINEGYVLHCDSINGVTSTDVNFTGSVDIDVDLNVDGVAQIDSHVGVGNLAYTGDYELGLGASNPAINTGWQIFNQASTLQSVLLIQGLRARFAMVDGGNSVHSKILMQQMNTNLCQWQLLTDALGVKSTSAPASIPAGDSGTPMIMNMVTGRMTFGADSIIVAQSQSPTSSGTGILGEIAYDSSYIYVCTATNTWKRAALTGGY